jgi:hypothetical protein
VGVTKYLDDQTKYDEVGEICSIHEKKKVYKVLLRKLVLNRQI